MNKKKSKALAFLLAASLIIPSVDGVVSAAELSKDNVKPVSKIESSQEVAPEQNNTNQDSIGENLDTQNPITQNVAKIGSTQYTSLKEAIEKAKDGEVIELLADVTEDITVNKNITIDGKNKYKVSGYTIFKKGELKNLILKARKEKNGILLIGSESKNEISMNSVTIVYSIDKRYYETSMVCGNESNIRIENCTFTNYTNNGENVNMVSEWSYGLSLAPERDKQGKLIKYNKGNLDIINNTFDGAFRTMIPSINGNVTIKGNTFKNSVVTVAGGPTGGAGPQATCITTDDETKNNFVIQNNIFDNAGAFLFQDTADVRGNTFKFDRFSAHYIQRRRHVENKEIDLTNNIFEMGKNKLNVMDSALTPVILPTNVNAIAFWTWNSSEGKEDKTQSNLFNYVYKFNEDGSRIFYPSSEKALKEFVNPTDAYDTSVRNNEKIVISENITIGKTSLDIPKDKNITIEVPKGKTLTLDSKDAMNITGTLNIVGNGKVIINTGAGLNVGDTGKLNVETNVENNGEIKNDGQIIIDTNNGDITGNKPIGSGKIEYEYTPSKPIHPTYDHTRIIGSDRYETAGKIADKLGSYDTAVLVNATSTMSDGLSAAGLAGKEDAAILLVKKDSIPKSTMDRLSKVKKVYIIGGENAISQKVVNQLKKNNVKVNVERLGGKTRVETSELVAKEIGSYKKAFVVNGFKGEADAMSASSVAAREEAPILLTNGKSSSTDRQYGVSYYVVGGKSVMNDSIVKKYKAERISGDDRYETNREMINEFYGASETLYFANGETLVDALTASTIAKDDGLVLVGRKSDNKILNKKNTIQVGGMKFDVDFEK